MTQGDSPRLATGSRESSSSTQHASSRKQGRRTQISWICPVSLEIHSEYEYSGRPTMGCDEKRCRFLREQATTRSFDELKERCSGTPVLADYDVTKDVTIQCDASSYGLGGVLLQDGRPIAYTSRALTPTEKRYAQLEKEMLAIAHGCKKFHYYIFGKPTTVESDHKPLQAICAKPLLTAPMRLQTMLLRLQPYDLNVIQARQGNPHGRCTESCPPARCSTWY